MHYHFNGGYDMSRSIVKKSIAIGLIFILFSSVISISSGYTDEKFYVQNDEDICGDKGLLEYKFFVDNSGEDKAEIYIRALLYGSSKGDSSPIHHIKIAKYKVK